MQEITQVNKELIQSLNLNSLTCQNNNQAFRICITPTCEKSSIICKQKNCQCWNNHQDCDMNIKIDKFLKPIISQFNNEISDSTNKSYQTIISEINQVIDKLSQIKETIEYKKKYCEIGLSHIQFIKLCQNKQFYNIKGKLACQVQKQQFGIRKNKSKSEKKSNKQIIKKNLKKKFDQMIEEIDKQIVLVGKYTSIFQDSKIMEYQDKIILDQWLVQILKQKKLQSNLIFRASQNQFSVLKFHQKCDKIKNTVLVVETQFGKKIGGFNPATWSSAVGYYQDLSKTSFIFSLSMKQKFMQYAYPKNNIYCNKVYGPVFGGGNGFDLGIYDQANINNNSYGAFPSAYKGSNNKYQTQNQQTYTLWSGAANGNNFKVKEYEIYEIIIQK